jgi:hypothetical protein
MQSPKFRSPYRADRRRANKNLTMKTSLFMAACCAIFALSTGVAHTQDSTSVPDTNPTAAGSPVDSSVHVGVDEQSAQRPQASRQPSKPQQTSYSHWAFESANQPTSQPSRTRFQHEHASDLLAQPGQTDNPSTLFNPQARSETPPPNLLRRGQVSPFGTSPIANDTEPSDPQAAAVRGLLQKLNGENGNQLQGLKSDRKAEPSDKTFFPSPFSRPPGWSSSPFEAESQKHTRTKPGKRNKPASLLDSQAGKQN